jgi:hypothetical protein
MGFRQLKFFSLFQLKFLLYTPVEAHVGASKQTSSAAVAETTAKALGIGMGTGGDTSKGGSR